MKFKKISAALTAIAMSATMVAGMAMSVSAADNTVVPYNVGIATVADEVTTVGKTIEWDYGDSIQYLNMEIWKTDMSEISMANDGIVKDGVTLAKSGDNFIMTIPTQQITKEMAIGSLPLKTYHADITEIVAYSQNGDSFTATKDGSTFTITFPVDTELPFVGKNEGGFENSIKLKFTTNFDSSLLNMIPAMKNPEAFALFNIE